MSTQTILDLFRNDIRATVTEAADKGMSRAEISFRISKLWGITLDQFEAVN